MNLRYAAESLALDERIIGVIEAWHRHGRALTDDEFDDLALSIFAYQLRYNAPYARYCASLGITLDAMPSSWEAIPAVPSPAFKESILATFDPAHAALAFETSGTTQGIGGRHYMENARLYDHALLAGFDRFMLVGDEQLRYLNLVPNPAQRPQSSLGYMMAEVSAKRGSEQTGWYLDGDTLLFDAFVADAEDATASNEPVCIATTAFALVHVLDALDERGLRLALPPGSRVMETGGFKGRARIVDRDELYARAAQSFGIDEGAIVAEYGMTELTSQYYDTTLLSREPAPPPSRRRKASPPWLRARVVGPDGRTLPNGTVGSLVHVDLANRSSCIAISTEDLGAAFDDGLVLIGREAGASLRGCSLDAESLTPR